MPIIQKQNAALNGKIMPPTLGGRLVPPRYFKLDNEGNAVLPAPLGAIIIRRGAFDLMQDGSLRISDKFLKPGPNDSVIVSGEILLIDPNGNLMIPNKLVPSCRTVIARERGHANNLLLKVHGGVGDIVCAEPAIRFAVTRFRDQKISLCTDYPEFFQHLKFEQIFPATGPDQPDYSKFLVYQNFNMGDELAWEFAAHALMSAVDYAAINMWRCILPNAEKEITIRPTQEQKESLISKFPLGFFEQPVVVVHPGKTWDSRTFPKKWWDKALASLCSAGHMPVLIGGVVDNGRASTVEVNTDGCLDMRGKLSFIETTALLQMSEVVLTNDSSPLHMAASGNAWVGFVSTVKHPDHLMHWRGGEFGKRMRNFADNNLYNEINFCPNQEKEIHVDKLHINELLKWLPRPEEFAGWAIEKLSVGRGEGGK